MIATAAMCCYAHAAVHIEEQQVDVQFSGESAGEPRAWCRDGQNYAVFEFDGSAAFAVRLSTGLPDSVSLTTVNVLGEWQQNGFSELAGSLEGAQELVVYAADKLDSYADVVARYSGDSLQIINNSKMAPNSGMLNPDTVAIIVISVLLVCGIMLTAILIPVLQQRKKK